MARKSKSRKYIPRNEFRFNISPTAIGHPNYVFGETKTRYKSLGLTTHPRDDIPHYALHKNPNPHDERQSYLQLKVLSTNKKYLPYKEKDWSFASEDMPIVRRQIKKYKKSTNRKPKNWYVNKRKWNKKIDEFRKQFVKANATDEEFKLHTHLSMMYYTQTFGKMQQFFRKFFVLEKKLHI